MNISGTDFGENNNNNNKPKKMLNIIKAVIIIVVIVLILIIGLITYMTYQRSQAFKVVIDGVEVPELAEGDVFIVDGSNVKVQLKGIAKYLGNYNYRNGQYGRLSQYTEDKTSCYLQNNNEIATFTQGLNTIEKVTISEGLVANTGNIESNDLRYEEFKIDSQVEIINNNIYTTLNGINIGCNVYATFDVEANTVKIYTLSKHADHYTSIISNAIVTGEKALFSNQKAILYDLIVVMDEDENYGVLSSDGTTVVIGEKYKSLKFIESSQEFIVQTAENKMGIISINGTESRTKITPSYETISEIDSELYLVSNNNKYGIINKNNQVIVNAEYDQIGLNIDQLSKYNLKNGYVIYDDCIPVKKDNSWGIISKSSRNFITNLNPEYTGIGCIIGTSSENSARNAILVPEYEAFVVEKENLYGVINSKGEILIPVRTERIEERLEEEENVYYFTFKGEEHNLIEYLTNVEKKPPVVRKETNNNSNTVVEENTVSENVTNQVETENIVDVNVVPVQQ